MLPDDAIEAINIEWDVLLPATLQGPDLTRTCRIWVSRTGRRLGGPFVSTTGFTEQTMKLDDESWRLAVEQAVRGTVASDLSMALRDDPGPYDHYVYVCPGTGVHRPLGQDAPR